MAPPVAGAQRPRRRLCLRYPKAEVYGAYHVLRDDDVGSVHVVLNLGAPFLIGLVVFYLSSGFFVVFFTAGFMELSRHMRLPSLWAGMGRAMNNVSAALIASGSVALLSTGNSLAAIVIALVLFVAVSVVMAVYTARMNAVKEPKEPPASQSRTKSEGRRSSQNTG